MRLQTTASANHKTQEKEVFPVVTALYHQAILVAPVDITQGREKHFPLSPVQVIVYEQNKLLFSFFKMWSFEVDYPTTDMEYTSRFVFGYLRTNPYLLVDQSSMRKKNLEKLKLESELQEGRRSKSPFLLSPLWKKYSLASPWWGPIVCVSRR